MNIKVIQQQSSRLLTLFIRLLYIDQQLNASDRAERYALKSRLLLFFSPFLFPPEKEKYKRKMNSQNRDQKSCLSARSFLDTKVSL